MSENFDSNQHQQLNKSSNNERSFLDKATEFLNQPSSRRKALAYATTGVITAAAIAISVPDILKDKNSRDNISEQPNVSQSMSNGLQNEPYIPGQKEIDKLIEQGAIHRSTLIFADRTGIRQRHYLLELPVDEKNPDITKFIVLFNEYDNAGNQGYKFSIPKINYDPEQIRTLNFFDYSYDNVRDRNVYEMRFGWNNSAIVYNPINFDVQDKPINTTEFLNETTGMYGKVSIASDVEVYKY